MFVLVTGATGKQGGAVSRALLARGHRVRALTRQSRSTVARHLAWLGAEIVEGDVDATGTLARIADGVDAMFAMTTFDDGAERERLRGMAMIDAARVARIGHVVFASAPFAKIATGVPHFDSKRLVEAHLHQTLEAFTIVAPGFFLENLLAPEWVTAIARGTLGMALPPEHRLDAIALADLGRFVVRVLEQPARYAGQRIDAASDWFTPAQAAATLARVRHHPCERVRVPIEWVRARNASVAHAYEWGIVHGATHTIDVAAFRSLEPDILWISFDEWCARQRWAAWARAARAPVAATDDALTAGGVRR